MSLDGGVPPDWWCFRAAAWRGNARAYIACVPFALVAFGGAIVDELGGLYDTGMASAACACLAGGVLYPGIVLFNRPRALVPPHLRDEPGALAERRRRKRRQAAR